MFIKLDKEYEIKCTLGAVKDIENIFNKPFTQLIAELDKMNIGEQIKLLYLGARRADPALEEEKFTEACENVLGLGELTEYLEQFIMQLQYPGKTQEEIRERIEKKVKRAEGLKASISLR